MCIDVSTVTKGDDAHRKRTDFGGTKDEEERIKQKKRTRVQKESGEEEDARREDRNRVLDWEDERISETTGELKDGKNERRNERMDERNQGIDSANKSQDTILPGHNPELQSGRKNFPPLSVRGRRERGFSGEWDRAGR